MMGRCVETVQDLTLCTIIESILCWGVDPMASCMWVLTLPQSSTFTLPSNLLLHYPLTIPAGGHSEHTVNKKLCSFPVVPQYTRQGAQKERKKGARKTFCTQSRARSKGSLEASQNCVM